MTRLFRSGSFGHGTSVSGYSDIDYFAVIPAGNLYRSSDYSLQKVRDSLLKRFPSTAISVRSPAVVVPFGRTTSERHEITPAYVDSSIYKIPNRYDGWMHSAPSNHASWVNQINDLHDKKVKQLIRLVKYWNYLSGAGIRSFYLEMRVAEYAASENSIIYSYDVKRALNFMLSKNLAAMQDPKGLVGYFHPCSDSQKDAAISRLSTAVVRCEKALEAEAAGRIADAFAWWDKVFFEKFPAYR